MVQTFASRHVSIFIPIYCILFLCCCDIDRRCTYDIAYSQDKHVGDLFSLRIHTYLYCTLAQIKLKGNTQYNIRWGSHYPPLAQKAPPYSHKPSLNKSCQTLAPRDISDSFRRLTYEGKLLEFDSYQIRCQRLGIERRNLEEQWFSIIRLVAPARIPPTGLSPTWPINLWSDFYSMPPEQSNKLGVIQVNPRIGLFLKKKFFA